MQSRASDRYGRKVIVYHVTTLAVVGATFSRGGDGYGSKAYSGKGHGAADAHGSTSLACPPEFLSCIFIQAGYVAVLLFSTHVLLSLFSHLETPRLHGSLRKKNK